MKRLISAVVVLAAALGLGACSKPTQLNDAPVGKIDDRPAFVITNPDEFPNVAIHCYGVNGIYATTRTGANGIVVVVRDPQCGGSGPTDVTAGK